VGLRSCRDPGLTEAEKQELGVAWLLRLRPCSHPYLPSLSLITRDGLILALSASLSTFLLLDEVLRGLRFDRETLVLSALLAVSALYDYAFVSALLGVSLYLSSKYFGRASYYLAGWTGVVLLSLFLFRGRLETPMAQTLFLIGIALIFLLFAERRDVETLEVGVLEKE
jgi:hypothetical protein